MPTGFVFSDKVFDLSVTSAAAEPVKLAKPITITVRLSAEDALLAVGDESNVVIQHYVAAEARWDPLPTTADFATSVATAVVDSLSIFALTIKEVEATPTPEPTVTATQTPPPTATASPVPTPTQVPTATPEPTDTPTATPPPTATMTHTPTGTPTNTPTITPVPTFTPSPVPTVTPVPTLPPTQTPTVTPIPTATFTPAPVPANLIPFAPTNWDAPLVLSEKPAVFLEIAPASGGPYVTEAEMYLHWSMKNDSAGAAIQPFQIAISIDGTIVMTFPIPALAAQQVVRLLSVPITVQGAGPHTVALIVDPNNLVPETNELDNIYSFIGLFQVATPTPTPSPSPTPIIVPAFEPTATFTPGPTLTPTSTPVPTVTAVVPTPTVIATFTPTATQAPAVAAPVPTTATPLPPQGLPVGWPAITKTWNGSDSDSWSNAGNWSPSGAPSTSDSVLVPASASTQPVLKANVSTKHLFVELGASVNTGAFTLTASGNVDAVGAITGSGTLTMTGSNVTLAGNVSNLTAAGSFKLDRGVTTTGNVTINTSKQVTLNGHTLTVGGNFTVNDTTSSFAIHLIMNNAADVLTVNGNATFGGKNNLAAGTINLKGNLTETSPNCCVLQPTGTTFVFNGSAAQTVSFADPGTTSSFLKDVTIDSTAGVTFATDIYIAGKLTLGTGGVLTQVAAFETYYTTALPSTTAGTYNVVNTFIAGHITMTENLTLSNADLTIPANQSLTLNGFQLTVDGDFTVQDTTSSFAIHLIMTKATDVLTVNGDTTLGGKNNLSAGTINLKGNLTETAPNCCVLQPTGTTFVFNGSGAQTVSFADPAITSSFLKDVTIANTSTAGVTFATNVQINGTLTMGATAVFKQGAGTKTSYSTFLPVIAAGNTSMLNININGTVTMTADLVLPNAGNHVVIEANKSLALNGHKLTVGGNFTVNDTTSSFAIHLIMTNALDVLTVNGNATFGGKNNLAAGTINLKGNLTETSPNCCVLQPTGTKFVFNGSAAQTVSFADPGTTSSFLKDVTIDNTTGVTLTTDMFITGQLTIGAGGKLTQAAGFETYYSGALPETPAGTYDVVNTYVNGVTMSADRTLPSSTHLVIPPNKSLTLSGHKLTVGGNFTVQDTTSSFAIHLIMTNAADVLTVNGNATFGGKNNLTAGTINLKGNLTETSPNCCVLQPTGTTFVFNGSGAQTVSFADPGTSNSFLKDVTIDNTAGVTLATDMFITGQLGSTAGTTGLLLGGGKKVTVSGGLNADGLILDNVAFDVSGGTITKFDNVTFRNYSTGATQFTISHPGGASPFAFNNLTFMVTPTTGLYINATDSTADANTLTISLPGSSPADGSSLTSTAGGAVVNW